MSGFADRENRRQTSVVAAMISTPLPKKNESDGSGRPKAQREIKKCISLAVLPSVYDDIKKISYIDRKSISEIVSEFFEQYIVENASKIKEYDKLYRD